MFKEWLGNAFGYAASGDNGLSYSPRSPIAKDLLNATRIGSKSQIKLMGRLHEESTVSPQNFQLYMEHLSRGIDYIHDRLGTHIDSVAILDDKYGIRVVHDHKTRHVQLIITLDDIEDMTKHYGAADQRCHQSKTQPYRVTYEQMTTLYGVEEAYHAYQLMCHYEKYEGTLWQTEDIDNRPDNYSELPIEKDAEVLVRQAAHHFAFFDEQHQVGMDKPAGSDTTRQRQHKPK